MRLMAAIFALAFVGALGAARADDANKSVVAPAFVEETKTSGVGSVYAGDWQYMVGGGVAAFDCDGSGFPDLLLAGGEGPASFYRNLSTRGGPLRFEKQLSGLELSGVTGAYPLDIDGDGITDIVLLRVGGNVLMRGLGNCRFERANERWGFYGGDAWSTSFAATWEHGAAWPTIAIGNYIDRTKETEPWGSCTDNWLHRPAGNDAHKFAPPLALKPSYCALSMLFTDWNRSGTPSLRVSDDREYYEGGQEQLWHVEPNTPPALYTEAEGWMPLRVWGMGIASYDIDSDGYPSYFITSMADSKLQKLGGAAQGAQLRPTYKDVAFAKGVTAHRPYMGTDLRPSTGWHAQFEDVNNDGLVDLFIAKGNVDKMPDFAQHDPNNLLVQTATGKFQEMGEAAGIANNGESRGAALVDLNLDGLPDLVVVNRRQNAQVYRNVTKGAGHWIEVKLEQPEPNRDGIGSWIEVRRGTAVMRREITSGGGHASGQLGWWHFGLGDTTQPEIRVIWPGGATGDWQRVASDGFYVLAQGKPAQPWLPKR